MLASVSVGSAFKSRENNFNFIRLVAAILVIWSHSYALLPNGMASDPLVKVLGFGWAGIAVNSFFVISGFLIVASFLRRENLLFFLQARFFRIFPGLFVAVCFCVFVIGPLCTKLSLLQYFSEFKVWKFFYSNLGLYERTPFLPGVFVDNKSRAVNGSLWTLSYEVTMYLIVALIGFLGLFRRRYGVAFVVFVFAAYYIFSVSHPELAVEYFSKANGKFLRLSLYFLLGALFYIYRESIYLNLFGVLGLWVLSGLAYGGPIFKFIFAFSLSYSVLWLALVPKGAILAFNKYKDISYGVYIYAFPIQQLVISLSGGISEYQLFFYSLLLTLPLSWVSNAYVELPSLRLGRRITTYVSSSVGSSSFSILKSAK